MKDLRSEVAPEEAPYGAVEAEKDVMLVAANDLLGWNSNGAISKGASILYQCLVCKEAIRNENICVRAYVKSED